MRCSRVFEEPNRGFTSWCGTWNRGCGISNLEIHVPLKPGMLVPWTLVVGGFTCLLHVPSLPWNDSDICSSSTGSRFVVVSMTALSCSRFPKRTSVPSVGTVSPTRSQEGLSKRAFFERCFGRDGMGAGAGRGHTKTSIRNVYYRNI